MDIEKLRRDTPGCANVLHFNHAGASLPPRQVVDAMKDHLDLEARIGPVEAFEARLKDVAETKELTARLLNAEPSEIAFTGSSNLAWHLGFDSLGLQPGQKVLVHAVEWGGNLTHIHQTCKGRDVQVELVPSIGSGEIDVEALERMIDDRTAAVLLTLVPSNGGLVNPAAEVGRITRRAGVPYIVDAAQAVGQIVVDVKEIGCDVLATNSRKFMRGPRGVGIMFARQDFMDRTEAPYADQVSAPAPGAPTLPDARRYERWESSTAARLGFREAVRLALDLGMNNIEARVAALADRLRQGLGSVGGVTVRDIGRRLSGIVSLTIDGVAAADARKALGEKSINAGMNPSVYAPFDMDSRGLPEILRLSVHYFNTDDEVDRVVAAVAEIARR